jgi:hypothetical protein
MTRRFVASMNDVTGHRILMSTLGGESTSISRGEQLTRVGSRRDRRIRSRA